MSIKEITCQELNNLLQDSKVIIVDVRETSEHQEESIPGSVLLPLSQFDCDKIKNLTSTGQKLVLHCRSGKRSEQAANKLLQAGFPEATHLAGGILGWKEAGYPVEKKVDAPISLFRQIQIVAGSLVFLGTILGAFVNPLFLILSGFVGAGLMVAGITNTCALGMLLSKLPYNNPK